MHTVLTIGSGFLNIEYNWSRFEFLSHVSQAMGVYVVVRTKTCVKLSFMMKLGFKNWKKVVPVIDSIIKLAGIHKQCSIVI
jgi:hypothetical protein